MEIILKQDVKQLGYKNEVVKVKKGYALNYLIPNKLGTLVTPSVLKAHEEMMKQKAFKEEKIIKDATKLAEVLETLTVKIGAKVAATGKIFGSVNAIQIADAIKTQFDYDIDKKTIIIDRDSVKEVGTYSAVIRLHKDVKIDMKFEVVAE